MSEQPDGLARIDDPAYLFPKDMTVRRARQAWSLNNTARGEVCLWIRDDHSIVSMILDPAEAEHLMVGLRESVLRARQIAATLPTAAAPAPLEPERMGGSGTGPETLSGPPTP